MNTVADILQDLELSNFDLEQGNHLATPLSTTKSPLISIIVPVYNGSKYINTAIKSILKQSYSNYEIIVIDDGSTDDTHDQLQPYEDKIRYLYQANEGSASARNLGIKVAKGELIAFLDADDYWSMPEKLEKQVACFAKNPAIGCVNTGWRIVDGDNKYIKTVQPWHKAPELNLETWLKRKCVRTSAMIFRREWLEKVGGFDEELRQSHDVDLILRLSLAGCQTMWLKEETVCYRQHETNTTGNSLKQAKYVQAVLDKFFANQDLPESIREMESQVKYHTLVWLAWYQYRADNLDKMSELLQKSLDITPYLRVENIAHWLTSFEKFSQERGEKFDVDALTRSLQWQQLVTSALRLKNIIQNKQSQFQIKQGKTSSFTKQGEQYFQQGNKEKAAFSKKAIKIKQDALLKEIKFKSEKIRKYQGLGDSSSENGKLNDAANYYRKAIELQPDAWNIHQKLAHILLKQKKWNESISECRKVIDLNPNFLWSYYNLGRNLSQIGNWQEAISCYLKASKISYNPEIERELNLLLDEKIAYYQKNLLNRLENLKVYQKLLDIKGQTRVAQSKKLQKRSNQLLKGFSKQVSTRKKILCLMFEMQNFDFSESINFILHQMYEKKIYPIIFTDSVETELLFKNDVIFEYFPLTEKPSKFSDYQWQQYFQGRISNLVKEWSPQQVLNFGNTVNKEVSHTLLSIG